MGELVEIYVKNKSTYSGDGEYIGRGSPLGNPYKITDVTPRHVAINEYEIWIKDCICKNFKSILDELERLFNILIKNQKLILICHCSPKLCHGNIIKQLLINKYYHGSWLL